MNDTDDKVLGIVETGMGNLLVCSGADNETAWQIPIDSERVDVNSVLSDCGLLLSGGSDLRVIVQASAEDVSSDLFLGALQIGYVCEMSAEDGSRDGLEWSIHPSLASEEAIRRFGLGHLGRESPQSILQFGDDVWHLVRRLAEATTSHRLLGDGENADTIREVADYVQHIRCRSVELWGHDPRFLSYLDQSPLWDTMVENSRLIHPDAPEMIVALMAVAAAVDGVDLKITTETGQFLKEWEDGREQLRNLAALLQRLEKEGRIHESRK